MNLKFFILVLLSGLLIFGCIGGPQTQETDNGNNNTQNQNANTSNTQTNTQPEQIDLSSKTWEALVALGLPIECTITYKDPEVSKYIESTVLYMKGNKLKFIMKTSASSGLAMTSTFIIPDDGFSYYQFDNAQLMSMMVQGKKCDWIKINVLEASESQDPTQAFSDTSQVELKCIAGSFSDSIFTVTGTSCDMTEELATAQ